MASFLLFLFFDGREGEVGYIDVDVDLDVDLDCIACLIDCVMDGRG